jgi:hypothetical protein
MNSTIDGIAAVHDRPPRSATPFRAGLLGIAAGLLALWVTRDQPALDAATRAVIASVAIIGTIALHEIFVSRVYLRPSAGLSRQALRPLGLARVATRLGALTSIYAGIGAIYWLLPEYHGAFYLPFWSLLRSLAPYVIVAAPFYFAWMDRHQRDTDDAYLLWGRYLLRRERPASWQPVREMLAGWGVKAFFLPLMTVYLSKDADHLSASLANALHAPMTLATFVFLYDLSFTMDLMFGTVGYLCTFRILDSHVRSVEPTALGWGAALICYQPFWSLISNNYIRYEGSLFWDNWLLSAPTLRVIWGGAIILLLMTYALSTISFGLRFSNLTNRDHHVGPVPVHEASGLHHEEPVVLDGIGAVRRAARLAGRADALCGARRGEPDLLHAREDGRTASDARSGLSRVCGMDRAARVVCADAARVGYARRGVRRCTAAAIVGSMSGAHPRLRRRAPNAHRCDNPSNPRDAAAPLPRQPTRRWPTNPEPIARTASTSSRCAAACAPNRTTQRCSMRRPASHRTGCVSCASNGSASFHCSIRISNLRRRPRCTT